MASSMTTMPRSTDTIIIGNGPAALILSYILHGNIPYYAGGHTDTLLDSKLSKRPDLLDVSPDLYQHFQSSLRYSTQALPINTLLDTLLRPNADTEINSRSCIRWCYQPEKAVAHMVFGDAETPGGQWQENPVTASLDIGTLSYAEMLSLPGYTFARHWKDVHDEPMPDLVRPSRKEVADYFKAYPAAVGISGSILNGEKVSQISRTRDGFRIGSHDIECKHLVLGSGTFSTNIVPPPSLKPLTDLHCDCEPLLVIGSGFSAADVIITAPENRKIIHIFKWAPETRPSPLKGCHHQAYPEYAGVYRQMKTAALNTSSAATSKRPNVRRKSKSFGIRDWSTTYEGLPNATINDTVVQGNSALIKIKLQSGEIIERHIGELKYVIGRRGTLNYLETALLQEVIGHNLDTENTNFSTVSTKTLRPKAEQNLEVAPGIFIIGSLAGDSLIRHTFGTCVYAASKIIDQPSGTYARLRKRLKQDHPSHIKMSPQQPDDRRATINDSSGSSGRNSVCESVNSETDLGHHDLHVDRRTLPKAKGLGKTASGPVGPRRTSWLRFWSRK